MVDELQSTDFSFSFLLLFTSRKFVCDVVTQH